MTNRTNEVSNTERLAEALNLGLECALELVAEKAAAFKGYPDKVAPYLRMVDFIRSELAALAAHEAAAEPAGEAVPADSYGSTELPYEIIGADLTDGDRRLMRLVIDALGNDHPAYDDLIALVMAARCWKRPAPAAPAAESASIEEWERQLSAVMPADFKDWWQNSRREWPAVAAAVIRSQRADRDLGWEMAAKAAPAAEPLTDEQIDAMAHKEGDYDSRTCCWSFNGDPDCRYNLTNFARAIERACSEKWGVQLASGGEVRNAG